MVDTKTNAEQICQSFVKVAANYSRQLRNLKKDYNKFLKEILKDVDNLPEHVKEKIKNKIKKLED